MSKIDWEINQRTRSKGGYLPYPRFGQNYSNSFFPYMTKLWNKLPPDLKCKGLVDFKLELKLSIKPSAVKHYAKGSKEGNIFPTRLRLGRSDLNLHKFSIGQIDRPECLCHAKEESTRHYLIDCFLFSAERQTLFSLVEHYIPNFLRLSKTAKCKILLFGLETDDPDFDYLNFIITISVQNYILQTKRFAKL